MFKNARIMTFGYDAKAFVRPFAQSTRGRTFTFSETLLSDLSDKRTSSSVRMAPVFLCGAMKSMEKSSVLILERVLKTGKELSDYLPWPLSWRDSYQKRTSLHHPHSHRKFADLISAPLCPTGSCPRSCPRRLVRGYPQDHQSSHVLRYPTPGL